ncbi:MAG TPA: DUF2844 domain-containing protein [Nitrospirota bacterium]|nr:DUF2844 domain-containing protein [Nitrospirota bacterium]
MKNGICSRFLCLFFLATVLVTAKPALAVLGESVDSISSDRRALVATRGSVTVHDGYQVQEIGSDAITIREYISPSGVVFAIAWNGIAVPDLTSLLGSYANDYQTALKQAPRKPGRRFRQIKTDRVVVERWGHMRNLQGRAYSPALVPQGVSIDEIK